MVLRKSMLKSAAFWSRCTRLALSLSPFLYPVIGAEDIKRYLFREAGSTVTGRDSYGWTASLFSHVRGDETMLSFIILLSRFLAILAARAPLLPPQFALLLTAGSL